MNRWHKKTIHEPQDDFLRDWFGRLEWPAIDADFQFDQQRWHQELPRRLHQRKGTPRPWRGIAAGVLVLASGVGVGTYTFNAAHSPGEHAVAPGPQFLAAQASPVIVDAMKALGSHPGVALEAPQVIPYAKQPTTTLSATAQVFGGRALPTYQVELWKTDQAWPVNSPHILRLTNRRLAMYSGTNYGRQGAHGLQEGLKIESGYSVAPGPTTPVSIAPGIIGQESRTVPAINSLAAASLRWTASAWRVVVNAPSIRMARQESRQLADRLESLSLPRPTTGGYLVVNSTSSVTAQGKPRIATEVVITWNRGLTVYQVTTYSDVRQRMATALAIAHSMRLYESARS